MNDAMVIGEIERCLGRSLYPDFGLLVLDFGVYFPHENQDILSIDVELLTGLDTTDTCLGTKQVKLNHRYPNRKYVTLSRVCDRRVCKCGCFWEEDIHFLNQITHIRFRYVIDNKTECITVPVLINLSEIHKYTGLTMHLNLDNQAKPSFVIYVNAPVQNDNAKYCGWCVSRYVFMTNDTSFNVDAEFILMDVGYELSSNCIHHTIYDTAILLPECDLCNICVT